MTDRELLELAAKAAGIKGFRYANNEPIQGGYRTGLWSDLYEDCWNPLADDGDALRLSTKCQMTLAFEPSRGGWSVGAIVDGEFRWLAHDDGVRRAITRAAAEIGRKMK